MAHRAVYEFVNGKIPDGKEIDHVCRNRACVKPDPLHCEAVTHAVNILRSGPFKRWKFCSKGHPLSGDNLKKSAKRKTDGSDIFRCKACSLENEKYRQERLIRDGFCRCGRERDSESKTCSKCKKRALAYWYAKNNK